MPFPLLLHRFLTFGRRSEIQAIDYLRQLGFRIVTSGYRTRTGEVDVVAWEGDVLVFVEVKSRKNTDPPEDAVGPDKQQRVIRAAHEFLSRRRLTDVSYRFDILAVTARAGQRPEFRLFRDAFNVER